MGLKINSDFIVAVVTSLPGIVRAFYQMREIIEQRGTLTEADYREIIRREKIEQAFEDERFAAILQDLQKEQPAE
jgi:hypothetical protein